jgi:hypothetical protein
MNRIQRDERGTNRQSTDDCDELQLEAVLLQFW